MKKFNPQFAARDCVITCPTCGDCAPLNEDRILFVCPSCGYQVPADQVDDSLVSRYCFCNRLVWHGDAAPWETPLCGECVWDYPGFEADWER